MTLQTPKRNPLETNPLVNDLIRLKSFVRQHLLIFVFICATVFGICAYFYQKHTVYVSSITFLVNSSNVADVLWDRSADGPIEVVNDDRGYNRINQIIYSSQMIDFLIEKFDLYKHYGIDKNFENSYLSVSYLIKKNLNVSISKTKIITVQVSDRLDYNVAANMANAIGKKINDVNRQITVESLTRKTEIFETLSKDLRSNSQREFSQMDSLLNNMQRMLKASMKDDGYKELLMMHIENLKTKSEDYVKDLFESYKYRLYSMYSLQEKNLPTISVLEKALPNKYSKSRYSYIFYPLLMFFSVIIPLFFAYILITIKPALAYIFKGPSNSVVK
jgi:hypothetical protein